MELAIIIIFTLLLVLLGSSFASFAANHAEPLPRRRLQRRSSSSELITTTSTTTARRSDRFSLFERTITASSSSIGEENADQTKTTDAVMVPHKYKEIADKMAFVEQTEHVPLGQLTQDIERNMLSLMRQLSHMGRRHDDTISSSYLADGAVRATTLISSKKDTYLHNGTLHNAQQRRQDAAVVERLLDRLVKEYQYSVDNTDGIITEQWGNDDYDNDDTNKRRRRTHQCNVINARIYNLAIKAWANANIRGSAEKAERVLKRLKIAGNRIGQRGRISHAPIPDMYSFAYCYAAWYKESIFASKQVDSMKSSTIALRKAESVLQSMKQILMLRKTAGDGRIVNEHELNMAEDVNSLLTMWSTADPTLPDLQETFLRFIEGESRDLDDIWLNTRSFNLVINAWAKSGRTESVSRSEALLQIMEMSHKISPDLLSYSGVISCIANSNRSADVARAECILDLLTDGKNVVQPDTVLFNQLLNIYCKQGSRGATEKCEALLERMEDLVEKGNDQVCPDVRTYNLLISAYANELGPAEAEAALRRLEMHPSIQPDSDAYAKVGDAHNSLRILSLMEKAFADGNIDAKPTRRAYVSALNSLAKSARGDAGTRAEALVQRMEKLSLAGNTDLKPDTTVYNVLINCHKNSAVRAEKVLYRMGKRDVVSYSSVINVYSKIGGVDAAKRAQALLDEMQKEDVGPNAHTFNSAITAWSRSGSAQAAQKAEVLLKNMEALYEAGNSSLQPSAQVYTSVITAWANSNSPGSALRAEVLLKVLWAMYKRGNESAKPNVHAFTACINAWARSREKNAGERAEALLDQMIRLYKNGVIHEKPNVLTFTSAIHAYARTGVRDAASKANGILKKMEEMEVNPNLQTYNVLMTLWGNSQQQGAGKKAESILTKLENEYRDGRQDLKPTVVSYTSCINAWAKSTDHGKAKSAKAILDRMKEMHATGIISDKPNEVSFTAVINACATTYGEHDEKQEAFHIAYNVFKEISESEEFNPNHVTYSTFLRAISKLMPAGEKKDSVVSAAFRLCIRDGQCDANCLFHMKNAASSNLCSDLLGCDNPSEAAKLSVDDLPAEWTCNVKSSQRKRLVP